MTQEQIATRVVEHTTLHWDSIEDRENTIEQVLLRMTNDGGGFLWVLVANALVRMDAPSHVSELLGRIVSRLENNEIKLGKITKAVSEFADAIVNDEETMILSEKIRQSNVSLGGDKMPQ